MSDPPFGAAPAQSAEGAFTGAGGQAIVWRGWLPDAPPRSVVLVAHGFGEHFGRYGHVVAHLLDHGHAVLGLDHHGHGRSGGPRALVDFGDAVADLDTLADLGVGVRSDPGLERLGAGGLERPLFLLGHSMGGALALRYAMAHGDRLAGLVVSSPLVVVEGRPVAKVVGRALGRAAPRLPVTKLDAAAISRDPDVVAAYENDPLVHHGGVPAGTAAAFMAHGATVTEDVRGIRVPTLLLYGTADTLCPPTGSAMVAARIGSPDLVVKPFEGLYHEVFNEPEREQVLAELTDWLDARAPGAAASSPGGAS